MFCPECGQPLPVFDAHFCPSCGKPVNIPEETQIAETPVTRSKLCVAALILGAVSFVFCGLTLICRILAVDLRLLFVCAACTFFSAPLACVLGVAGVVVRARNPHRKGLPSAIFGLLLGFFSGLLSAAALLGRILFY